jgi:hypothetical protein
VKGRRVPSGVRGGSEQCENDAGGLFQHPAGLRIAIFKKAVIAWNDLTAGAWRKVERNIQVCSIDVALPENLAGSQT